MTVAVLEKGALRRRRQRRQLRRRAPAGPQSRRAAARAARAAALGPAQRAARRGRRVRGHRPPEARPLRGRHGRSSSATRATPASTGLRLQLLGAAAVRSRAAVARRRGGRRIALRRGRPGQSAPRRTRVRAPRAPARRRRARARRGAVGARAAATGSRSAGRAHRGAQPLPRQLRRRRRGPIAAGFGEDVPLQPLMPNMLVTEPLPFFISRSIGVCGGGVYLRQIARGNAILGGGDGWGDADIAPARGR